MPYYNSGHGPSTYNKGEISYVYLMFFVYFDLSIQTDNMFGMFNTRKTLSNKLTLNQYVNIFANLRLSFVYQTLDSFATKQFCLPFYEILEILLFNIVHNIITNSSPSSVKRNMKNIN